MAEAGERLCDVCGGRLAPYRRPWLARCRACATLASSFAPAIPETRTDTGIDEAAREEGLAPVRAINNERLLAELARLGISGRLLDVGCGPGFFLGAARDAGFEVVGVEPDANTVETGRRIGEVRHGYFPDASPAGERFDAIVMNDVLEHMPTPGQVVAACRERLGPGGVLVLNCPSRHGLFYRAADLLDRVGVSGPYERLWQRDLPSPHLWYFTPEALQQLGRRHGFSAAGSVRLATISVRGLWERISYVGAQSPLMNLASYGFALATAPAAALAPSDSVAVFLRRDAG
jgi:SAM-dependent methyltransferase